MRLRSRFFLLVAALAVPGCSSTGPLATSTAMYKTANKARLEVVEPWLQGYRSTTQPVTQQQISDVLQSWHIEVTQQQLNQ